MTLVCFDTETTGLDVRKEHIIQLSLVKFETDTWQVLDQRDWYLLPEGEFTIPAEAEAVHHISKDFLLEHGVSLRSVYDDFIAFVADCNMLSYNGNGYDAPILHYNLERLGLPFEFEGRIWFDALLLERIHTEGKVDENGEKLHNNLTAAYTRYYGHPFEGAHNSLDDVMATIEVFKAQIQNYGWDWATREEFDFISYDRWLMHKGGRYYLCQGGHKGESLDRMLHVDPSFLDWLANKCTWADPQTQEIVRGYLKPKKAVPQNPEAPKSSRGKHRSKPTITDADLSLF